MCCGMSCRYKLGFCPNGPDCRYRHQKMQGPPPSVEQNLQKIQHRVYAINGGVHHGKYPPARQIQNENQGQGQSQGEVQAWRPPSGAAPVRPVGPLVLPEDSHNIQHSRVQRPSPQQQPAALPPPSPTVPPHPVGNGAPTPPTFTSAAVPLPHGFCRLVHGPPTVTLFVSKFVGTDVKSLKNMLPLVLEDFSW